MSRIVITITLLFILSCQHNVIKVQEYNDKTLYRIYTLNKDSLLHGSLVTFYEDGETVFEKANYVNGKLDGQRSLHYRTGQVEIIETYKEGVITDTLYVFHENGKVKQTVPYENGILQGEVKTFYEDGILKEKVFFKNNVEQGPFIEYFKNGQPMWQGHYLNGPNEFGELLQFDSTGTLIRRLECDSLARCTTTWSINDEI